MDVEVQGVDNDVVIYHYGPPRSSPHSQGDWTLPALCWEDLSVAYAYWLKRGKASFYNMTPMTFLPGLPQADRAKLERRGVVLQCHALVLPSHHIVVPVFLLRPTLDTRNATLHWISTAISLRKMVVSYPAQDGSELEDAALGFRRQASRFLAFINHGQPRRAFDLRLVWSCYSSLAP